MLDPSIGNQSLSTIKKGNLQYHSVKSSMQEKNQYEVKFKYCVIFSLDTKAKNRE
jgi:hypothetical protein